MNVLLFSIQLSFVENPALKSKLRQFVMFTNRVVCLDFRKLVLGKESITKIAFCSLSMILMYTYYPANELCIISMISQSQVPISLFPSITEIFQELKIEV